jgi:hypothetical protein
MLAGRRRFRGNFAKSFLRRKVARTLAALAGWDALLDKPVKRMR